MDRYEGRIEELEQELNKLNREVTKGKKTIRELEDIIKGK